MGACLAHTTARGGLREITAPSAREQECLHEGEMECGKAGGAGGGRKEWRGRGAIADRGEAVRKSAQKEEAAVASRRESPEREERKNEQAKEERWRREERKEASSSELSKEGERDQYRVGGAIRRDKSKGRRVGAVTRRMRRRGAGRAKTYAERARRRRHQRHREGGVNDGGGGLRMPDPPLGHPNFVRLPLWLGWCVCAAVTLSFVFLASRGPMIETAPRIRGSEKGGKGREAGGEGEHA